MSVQGYFQRPTLWNDTIVFVCEDDLWSVDTSGGRAHRLTANPGRATDPHFSPGGRWLAFTSRDEGHFEVHLSVIEGGEPRRLTFLGADTRVVGWSPDGERVFYTSNSGQPFARSYQLGSVLASGGPATPFPWGPASSISFQPDGPGRVLGRHAWDPARWKRYRGGTAGQLWVDRDGDGEYETLVQTGGNVTRPLWVGERIYFGSDHEGICNLYSCDPDGQDLRRHTNHDTFYVRHPGTDGKRVVYQCGADIYLFDPEEGETRLVEIDFRTPRAERLRKFVNPYNYLESYDVHPKGHSLALIVRGRPFAFPHWEQSVLQLGERDGVRYRLAAWLHDGERLVCTCDRLGEEHLEVHWLDGSQEARTVKEDYDLGRLTMLLPSPKEDRLVAANHRNELLLVNLTDDSIAVIDRGQNERIGGFDWSPCGRWIVYSISVNRQNSILKLYSLDTEEGFPVTRPQFRDVAPSFDPEGRYLYFLSTRDFDPVWDNVFFELSFPKAVKPYLVTLRKDVPSPFIPEPRAPGEDLKKKDDKKKDKEKEKPPEEAEATEKKPEDEKKPEEDKKPLEIDREGIEGRVVAFPVPEGRYGQVEGLADQVLFTWFPVEGALSQEAHGGRWPAANGVLQAFEFKTQERKDLVHKVSSFSLSQDRKTLAYRSGFRLRVVQAGKKPEGTDENPGRKTGYINLHRLRVSVNPSAEWKQMFAEAWRLMRDHFWDADMSGVDWRAVYEQYLPQLSRVATRSEFSDLLWEFQGELGTSHAYEYGGDYAPEPSYPIGKLAADLSWDEEAGSYRVSHIVTGDSWDPSSDSPLNRPSVNVRVGDRLLAIDAQPLKAAQPPEELLVHQAGQEVMLTVQGSDDEKPRKVFVKTLRAETPARYREWVDINRARVHVATGGRVGYIHIPNMGPVGYSEFHRAYYSEVERDALIIDVRYNGGGNVSGLLLEKLSRRRLGYDVQRWGMPIPYPMESPAGPLVALTNESAGSDGDIFSHCFKLMKLGPLIGKRTWGGVIGIWPRHKLVDGTQTTQPEFAFWFEDVGWRVENYGTEPDEEVAIRPQDWNQGRDPQLERAIELALERLQASPPLLPDFSERPRRARPPTL